MFCISFLVTINFLKRIYSNIYSLMFTVTGLYHMRSCPCRESWLRDSGYDWNGLDSLIDRKPIMMPKFRSECTYLKIFRDEAYCYCFLCNLWPFCKHSIFQIITTTCFCLDSFAALHLISGSVPATRWNENGSSSTFKYLKKSKTTGFILASPVTCNFFVPLILFFALQWVMKGQGSNP